jgi:uncharacterized protein YjeT (DUF2065 family)
MANAIELTLSIFMLVLGASYLFQFEQWVQFFREAIQHPRRLFPIAMAMLAAGAFIATAYNDWSSTWPIFITALGWLMAIEGALILVFPGLLKRMEKTSDLFLAWYLRAGGMLLIILGALLLRY